MRAALVFALMCAASAGAQQPGPPASTPVMAEFRVFAGPTEITKSTRIRVMPTGKRDAAIVLEQGSRLEVPLAPAIYDVQALRLRDGAVAAIKWVERLVVMHYPDEGGRHVQVINFDPGYGALLVRATKDPIDAYDVTVFAAGERIDAAAAPIDGEDYRLFVLKAGRYDIRVDHVAAPDGLRDTHWFLNIEVPAERTRLKKIDGS